MDHIAQRHLFEIKCVHHKVNSQSYVASEITWPGPASKEMRTAAQSLSGAYHRKRWRRYKR